MRNFIKLHLITFLVFVMICRNWFSNNSCNYNRRIVFYPFYSHTCSFESVGKWLKYCRYNVNRLVIIKSTFWNGQTEDLHVVHVFDEHFIDNLRHYLLYLGRRKTYFILDIFCMKYLSVIVHCTLYLHARV